MKALVTGAHGFIGSHLTERLLAEGWAVRALVSPWGRLDNLGAVLEHPKLELTSANLTQPESLSGVCKEVDVVFHAAAKVADWGAWEGFYQTNVSGTEYLLKEAERSKVKRLVLVSSIAVHPYTGFREADTRTLPRDGSINAYAHSKVLAEDVAIKSDLEVVVIRPGLWPFGTRDPNFLRVVREVRRGTLPLVDGGTSVFNTAYAENLVQGLVLAGSAPAAAGRTYLIADEGAPTWRALFTELSNLLDAPKPRLNLPGSIVEPLSSVVETLYAKVAPQREPPLTRYRARLMRQDVHFSIENAKKELGYVPKVSWQEGLARTLHKLS